MVGLGLTLWGAGIAELGAAGDCVEVVSASAWSAKAVASCFWASLMSLEHPERILPVSFFTGNLAARAPSSTDALRGCLPSHRLLDLKQKVDFGAAGGIPPPRNLRRPAQVPSEGGNGSAASVRRLSGVTVTSAPCQAIHFQFLTQEQLGATADASAPSCADEP